MRVAKRRSRISALFTQMTHYAAVRRYQGLVLHHAGLVALTDARVPRLRRKGLHEIATFR